MTSFSFSAIFTVFSSILLQIGCSLAAIPEWDYMVYAQQWPATVCYDSKMTHEHKCVIDPVVNTWTVHGLWPTRNGQMGPNNCNATQKFNPELVKPLKDKMLQYWPNLYKDEVENSFWEHEWTKHGTCAESLPELSSEYKYFSQGLNLNRKFDLLSILKTHGITPKDDYTYQYVDVYNALKSGLGGRPLLSCVFDKTRKTQYLLQVEICIDKQFKVKDCEPPSQHERGVCWDTETLAYPVITHNAPHIFVAGDEYWSRDVL